MSNYYPPGADDDPRAPWHEGRYKPRSTFVHPIDQHRKNMEQHDYLGHAVQPEEFGDTEMIHVGLPFLSNSHNGYVKAKAQDGEVWLTVHGFGVGELSLPKEQAIALRDQLENAIKTA